MLVTPAHQSSHNGHILVLPALECIEVIQWFIHNWNKATIQHSCGSKVLLLCRSLVQLPAQTQVSIQGQGLGCDNQQTPLSTTKGCQILHRWTQHNGRQNSVPCYPSFMFPPCRSPATLMHSLSGPL